MADPPFETKLGKGLHIAHLNVRSMFGGHKFDLLKQQIKDSGIDIFTLSETWLGTSVPSNVLEVKGFDIVRLDRTWGAAEGNTLPKRGGGLACYVNKDLKYSESRYSHLNASNQNIEMLWLSVSIPNVQPIVVVTVYRPPQGKYKICCDTMSEAFERANLKDNTDIFVLGDFNIDYSKKQAPSTKELDFMTRSLGLREIVKTPTRVSFHEGVKSQTCIDLIFTNSDFVLRAKILDMNISDHLCVLMTRKKITAKANKFNFRFIQELQEGRVPS